MGAGQGMGWGGAGNGGGAGNVFVMLTTLSKAPDSLGTKQWAEK